MTTAFLATHQTDNAKDVLRKLSELSPQKRNMALTMCSFFIDGMNAQERLSANVQNTADQARSGNPQSADQSSA